ncbi:hypothetical protein [Paenibacillus elgii]|uniref:hypothetical protein n=1 Tax=Paenibacillus elgii TaxID=189691 RepID=UPI000248E0AE|nr:hypothetical protein [Paenibacillus elgii]
MEKLSKVTILNLEAENAKLRQKVRKLKEEKTDRYREYKILIGRLTKYIGELESIIRNREKKVVLPRKVVEAIEYLRAEGIHDFCIFQKSVDIQGYRTSRFCAKRKALGDYCRNEKWEGVQKLMATLVNGYIVEETREDRLENKLKTMLEAELPLPSEHNLHIAKLIVDIVKNVYAANRE